MPLPLILAAAVALVLLAVVAALLWAARARGGPDAPVTEAEARAHAMPLTKSVLSVGPQARDRGQVGLDV
jgi:uncharacterized iron-regulated membrane protein